MEVRVVTFNRAAHYGAQLQAYALRLAVERLGHDCLLLDYRNPANERSSKLFEPPRSLAGLARNAHALLRYPALKRRGERFYAFYEETPHTRARYLSIGDVRRDVPECDAFVAGSDQIWNPRIFESGAFDPVFALDFETSARKIAYAPSFGKTALPEKYHAELKRFTAGFHALSSREEPGAALLRKLSGRYAAAVCDPTLLLTAGDWSEAAVSNEREKYVLVYTLSGAKVPQARAAARERGARLVQLCGTARNVCGADEYVFDAGPREFLGLIKNAERVFTDSFHGRVFSNIFGKAAENPSFGGDMRLAALSGFSESLEKTRAAGLEYLKNGLAP